MNEERLTEIEERAGKATKDLIAGNNHILEGSYDLIEPKKHMDDNIHVAYFPRRMPYRALGNKNVENDFKFYFHALQDVDDLCKEVRILKKKLHCDVL